MPSDFSIFMYGRDALLLQTRCWALEKAGFSVRTTVEFRNASRIIMEHPFELFIVCHTLSAEERDSVLATAHTLRPKMKNLVLTPHGMPYAASPRSEVLDDFAGAKAFITMVKKMTGSHRVTASSLLSK